MNKTIIIENIKVIIKQKGNCNSPVCIHCTADGCPLFYDCVKLEKLNIWNESNVLKAAIEEGYRLNSITEADVFDILI